MSPCLDVHHVDGHVIVRFPDEVDLVNAEDVGRELVNLVLSRPLSLVIDMSTTTFCGSVGMDAVLKAHARRPAGTQVSVAGCHRSVLRSFVLLGVSDVVPFYPRVSDALAAYRSAGPAPAVGPAADDAAADAL